MSFCCFICSKNGPTTFQQLSPCHILLRSLCGHQPLWAIDCIETRSRSSNENGGNKGSQGHFTQQNQKLLALLNLLNLLATHGVMHIISLHGKIYQNLSKSIKIYQNLPQHAFSESRSAKDHETTCLKSHPATKPSNVHFLNLKGPPSPVKD